MAIEKSLKSKSILKKNTQFANLPEQPINKPPGNTKPSKIIVREIDIVISDNMVSIDYSKTHKIINSSDIISFLKKLASGEFEFDNYYPEKKPKMSLNIKQECYIIFKLSNKNWQFSSQKRDPITLGSDIDYNDLKCYSDLNLVDAQGNIVAKPYSKTECRIAYCAVDGEQLVKNHTNQGKYINSFNLNVEIYDPINPSMVMPILIDPDIRNPGGSGS
jgi:hypothetical protein